MIFQYVASFETRLFLHPFLPCERVKKGVLASFVDQLLVGEKAVETFASNFPVGIWVSGATFYGPNGKINWLFYGENNTWVVLGAIAGDIDTDPLYLALRRDLENFRKAGNAENVEAQA